MDVDGRTVVVTGGAGGLGRALSHRFAAGGARVAVVDLDEAAAHRVASELPGVAFGFGTDVADEEALRATLQEVSGRAGPIDVFVANAGVGFAAHDDEDGWSLVLEVNVLAHVRAARILLPEWIERGDGYFVSIASAAGLLTQLGSAPYAVSKHAAVAYAEWLAVTYGEHGIGVSCVCPMGVDTPMLANIGEDRQAQGALHAIRTAGAVLSPEAVADAVVDAIGHEEFLVLPHPEVLEFFRRRANDHPRWLAGMQRLGRTKPTTTPDDTSATTPG